jgi:hypothetical protein
MQDVQRGDGRQSRRGAKLAEVALYLAVAMAIFVGSLSTYREANVAATVAAQARALTALTAEARVLVALGGVQGGRIDSVLVAAGAVPADSIARRPMPFGAPLRTEWDGELALTFVDLGSGPRLHLRLHDLPVPACTRLASADAAGTGVFTDGIRALALAGSGTVEDAGPPPWTIARVAELCSAAAGGSGGAGVVTVTWLIDPH